VVPVPPPSPRPTPAAPARHGTGGRGQYPEAVERGGLVTTAGRGWRLRPVHPGWWLDAVLLAGFGAVTLALAWSGARAVDVWLRDWSDSHRPAAAQFVAQAVNLLGQGGPLTSIAAVLALWLAWRRRSGWPLVPVVVAFLLVGLAIQPLKLFFHRAAPHAPLDGAEVNLFSQPGGLSYPSGHAVNTVVWYGVIALLVPPIGAAYRALRLVPPIAVTFSATYLGYHWLTDMLAGICLGVVIDRALWRVPWPGLRAAGRAGEAPDHRARPG
jgi:membrane-associated phospholipid phosphatase